VISLDAEEIVRTVEKLERRIAERFPGGGLSKVCGELLGIARDARRRAEAIAQPILAIRIGTGLLIALITLGVVVSLTRVRPPSGLFGFSEFIQMLEAGINDVVLIGAAVFFLVTVETRLKRRRALSALHELRSIAHIIDMHQLTKDPELMREPERRTASSPDHGLTAFELGRYLDYCSEMLSLTGKVAALYIQAFEDSVVLQAVNEIEDLTSGLSGKIWQKLVILHETGVSGRR